MGSKPSSDQKTVPALPTTTTAASLNSVPVLVQPHVTTSTTTLISAQESNQQAEDHKNAKTTTAATTSTSHQQLRYGATSTSSETSSPVAEASRQNIHAASAKISRPFELLSLQTGSISESEQLPFTDAANDKKTASPIITSKLRNNAATAHASTTIGTPICQQSRPSQQCAAYEEKTPIPQARVSDALARQVLKWTLQDIMNDHLLLGEVKPIPEAFSNLQEYFDCFKWPLLEEIRAQLKQALADHKIDVTPYARVSQMRQTKGKCGEKSRNCIESRIDVLVERTLERQGSGIHNNHTEFKLFAMDLVLLSTIVPRCAQDLNRVGELHTFALVLSAQDMPISDTLMRTTMAIQASSECIQYQELLKGERTWYALFVENLTPSLRIWKALHPNKLTESSFPIIRETLSGCIYSPLKIEPGGSSSSSEPATTRDHALASEAARDYCSNSHKLNDSQTNAIVDIVSDLEAKRPPFVRMIQGPPGTGKTSAIVMLLALASCLNLKCLVTAPTNAAISELAIRFMNFISTKLKNPFRNSFTQELASVNVKDVVLLGNQEKLRLQGGLEELFLPERVKRLMMAQTGWRNATSSILDFLMFGNSQYEQKKRVDLELHSPASKDHGNSYPSFQDYARNRLSILVKEAELYGKCLIRELPTTLIGKTNMKRLSETIDLATTLRDLFLNFDSQPAAIQSKKILAATTPLLSYLRETCKAQVHSKMRLEASCMKDSRVIFCTVSTAGRECMKWDAAPFDLLIIDEAGQLLEAETAIVSQMPGLSKAVLVGDHQQLGATVISQVAARCAYGRSLFERLQSLGHPSHLLSIQYRMHPDISSFPNSQFYDGRIADGENVKTAKYTKIYQKQLYGPFAVIDVGGDLEEDDSDTNKSKKNLFEAAVITLIIRKLSNVIAANNIDSVSVGVIASYASQVSLLKKQLETVQINPSLTVEVNSVDSFQGQERDIILLSTVRANKHGDIGFLKDHRRMNVALTRARYCLWIVGNAKTLSKGDDIWRTLMTNARNKNSCTHFTNNAELQKEIQKMQGRETYASVLQTMQIFENRYNTCEAYS